MAYDHIGVEKKWQKYWEDNKIFKTENPVSSSPPEKGEVEGVTQKGILHNVTHPNLPFSWKGGNRQKPKKYILDMFPYPSGAGLHVGHPKGYTATDIVSRYYHATGHNVLHTMGFDAFGLPAENYAIKTGTHPAITTAGNIRVFIEQLKSLGFSYDWDRMVDTTDPEYYKWTQWIFIELFKRGLAYEQDLPINYCPSCKTGLANEEVTALNTCDRCGTRVEKRALRQWVLKITEYAERLIDDLDGLDWPEGVKEMQRNWIGKSEGCEFEMRKSDDSEKYISVYTTRVDTVYGMTYAVLAPDHPRVYDFITDDQSTECESYITEAASRSDQDRTNEGKEKTGVWTGSYVINPYNNEAVPLWIADYVLGHYGTGAVMAVPAHDERDGEFARKYDLPIKQSIEVTIPFDLKNWKREYGDDGIVMEFNISSPEARKIFSEKAETEGFGHKKVNYKLRDWLFSRQRYWGEPIPLIHLAIEDVKKLPHIGDISDAIDMNLAYILKRDAHEDEDTNGVTCCSGKVRELIIGGQIFSKIYDGITGKLIIDARLPITLPEVEKYEPAGDGQSPLATVPSFVNVKLAENLNGKRETNTMPQWGGSCWYYLRYMDPQNPDTIASPEALDYWGMVDEYVGGAEHAVLHLLYARFWHKVLYDIGVVPQVEPFQKLVNQGMILAYAYERADGGLVAVDLVTEKEGKYFETSTGKEVKQVVAKMSKSLKNVVNPNDIIHEYGADTLRLYEMSMSAFTDTAPWNPDAIIGVRRLLDKAYSMVIEGKNPAKDDMKAMKLLHKTIKKVGEDIVEYKFNTAISALQILLNEGIPADAEFAEEWKEKFTILLHPFAPHMAEELYEQLSGSSNQGSEWNHKNNSDLPTANCQLPTSRSVYFASWPEYDEFMLIDDDVVIAIQVGGKLRGTLNFLNGVAQEEVSIAAMADPSIAKWLEGKTIVKEIFIPNKMLSIVVRD